MYDMKVILLLEALFLNAALIGFSIGFILYGLSGKLKNHLDYVFKKKNKGENSGNKFG